MAETNLGLTDYLALERTILANERTLLSYVRTSLSLLAAAITIFFFLPSTLDVLAGVILFVAGIFVGMCGVLRFGKVKTRLDRASKPGTADTAAAVASQVHGEKASEKH